VIKTCRFCSTKIMLVGALWLRAEIADVNGYCPDSDDDRHHPQD
jgi:hypothetical protein